MKKIEILIERPDPWINNPIDGYKHSRFFSNLLEAVKQCNLNYRVYDIPFGGDFAPRLAAADQIILSYHSVGIGQRIWRLKESYVHPYYYFDRTGYSGWAEISYSADLKSHISGVNQKEANDFVKTLSQSLIDRNESKYPQSKRNFESNNRSIFLPLQTTDDCVARLSNVTQLELLDHLPALCKEYDYTLVIKRHPLCNDQLIESKLLYAASQGAIITDASIHCILQSCTSVITVNSGVGFEALLHGKPVFTTGHSDYAFVTHKIASISDLNSCFSNAQLNYDYINKFIYFFLNDYCIDSNNIDSFKKKIYFAIDEATNLSPIENVSSDFVFLESIKYFSDTEGTRRDLVKSRNKNLDYELQIQKFKSNLASFQDKVTHLSAFKSDATNLIFALYDRLSTCISGLTELKYKNKSPVASYNGNFQASYYQKLHDNDIAFQQNNWLLPYAWLFKDIGINSLREVGCGNGAFLRDVVNYIPTVIGIDWAYSPSIGNDSRITYVNEDITTSNLSMVDINCSADVLEHLPFEKLSPTIEKLHFSAAANFHVIACYDDGHSHLTILSPDEWLYIFRQFDVSYRIVDITVRHNDVNKLTCVITNMVSN